MPSSCAVLWCYSDKRKTEGIRYFTFPKDKVIQQHWISACAREDDVNVKHAIMCSRHFAEDAYELKKRLLTNVKYKRMPSMLKKTAVPTLCLSPPEDETDKPYIGGSKVKVRVMVKADERHTKAKQRQQQKQKQQQRQKQKQVVNSDSGNNSMNKQGELRADAQTQTQTQTAAEAETPPEESCDSVLGLGLVAELQESLPQSSDDEVQVLEAIQSIQEEAVEELSYQDQTCNFVSVDVQDQPPMDAPFSPSAVVDKTCTYPTPVDPLADCDGDDDVTVKFEPLLDDIRISAPPPPPPLPLPPPLPPPPPQYTPAHTTASTPTPVAHSSPRSHDSTTSLKRQRQNDDDDADDGDDNRKKKKKKSSDGTGRDKEAGRWREAEVHLTRFLRFASVSSYYSDAEVAKIYRLLLNLRLKRAEALKATKLAEQDLYDSLNTLAQPSEVTASEAPQNLESEACEGSDLSNGSEAEEEEEEEDHLDDSLRSDECVRAVAALSEGSWSSVRSSDKVYPYKASEELCIRPTPTGSRCLPIEVYSMFVSDKVLDAIVKETNRFAAQEMSSLISSKRFRVRGWRPTNRLEVKRLMGILLYRGTVHYPEPHLYWSKTQLYANTLISSAMDWDRFQLLCRMLHFAGDCSRADQQKNHKEKTFFEQIIDNYQTVYRPGSEVMLEEAVIPLVGRGSSRKGRSVTLFKVCSVDGYTWSCEAALSGRGNTLPGLGPRESVAARLMSPLLKRGTTLYCDDPHITSVPLAEHLLSHVTYLYGSVDPSHAWLPHELTAARVYKGQVVSLQNDKGVKVFHWIDDEDNDKSVLALSTVPQHNDDLAVADMAARKAQSVTRPRRRVWLGDSECITSYTTNAPRNTNSWNYKVAVELLCGTSVVNAWVIYNKYLTDKKLSMLAFKERLILSLLTDSPSDAGRLGTIELPSMRHHFLVEAKGASSMCVGCYEALSVMGISNPSQRTKRVSTCCQMCVGSPYMCTDCFISNHN